MAVGRVRIGDTWYRLDGRGGVPSEEAPEYLYENTITVDSSLVDSDLSDYVIYVKLDNTNFDFSLAKTDGTDVIFTDNDDNLLPFDIEQYSSADEEARFYVRNALISSSTDTTFKMKYGKTDATDQSDSEGTYTADYKLVCHMNLDNFSDRTANNNDGTATGTTPEGLFGTDFNGSSDKVVFPDFGDSAQRTLQTIISGSSGNVSRVIAGLQDTVGVRYNFLFYANASGNYNVLITDSNGTQINQATTTAVGDHLLTLVYDNGDVYFYVNDTLVFSDTTTLSGDQSGDANVLVVGADITDIRFYSGTNESVILLDSAKSADEIKADYHNVRINDLITIS